ncbi:16S rRNA (cytosine(1402)-N(4))-methyltransferase RsmH [bacterium]|nr:16S rRNA (cytosine(1402)-N(4))-methyltransferase RsmH [bacterium]NBX72292.1 16S rRNA (cytosine(1402)-N(4))-methyltransferase RsmH [bacterium]
MHQPVLLNESLEALITLNDGRYLDATFGRGGHSKALLNRLQPEASLIVCDRDPTAITAAASFNDHRLSAFCCNYSDIFDKLENNCLLNGILADFGLCSAQLDNPDRGFSFQYEGPLDMRMSQNESLTLAQLIDTTSEKDLANIIYEYGEERLSRKIAKTILERRKKGLLKTTKDLAQCAIDCYPKGSLKHPATRTFQALRIALNAEMDHLELFLKKAPLYLCEGGRLVVITFHSLEYTKVKTILNHQYDDMRHGRLPFAMKKVVHPLFPSENETRVNPRARSARLHIYEKFSE